MGDYWDYNEDVQRIKSAILQSQYETGRVANSNQLALYYGIGSYVSANTRSGKWGTGGTCVNRQPASKGAPRPPWVLGAQPQVHEDVLRGVAAALWDGRKASGVLGLRGGTIAACDTLVVLGPLHHRDEHLC